VLICNVERQGLAARQNLALNIAYEHDSARVIRSLYECGAGFTFTPACAVLPSPTDRPSWLIAAVTHPGLHRDYSLATALNRPLDAAGTVVAQTILREARALIRTGRWEATWTGDALGTVFDAASA